MSKTKTATKKPADDKDKKSDGGWRETVESIAMAVILALLFRGFVAEAFVIPTGSMAPTLQGRHKDVKCSKCGFWYQTSASEERNEDQYTGRHIVCTTCPICRYPQKLDLFNRPNDHSFSGDRIIVGKFCYDLGEPQRWDVIVFKFPGRATQNYIKRLVGLPNERLVITGGNIYTSPLNAPDDGAFRIARKPPHKLLAMLQLVDDSDYLAPDLIAAGWPTRWQEWTAGEKPASWKADNGGKSFTTEGKQDHDAWLRYRHLIPSADDWLQMAESKRLPSGVADRKGQLITDFYAYNAGASVGQVPGTNAAGHLTPAVNDLGQYNPALPGPCEGPDEDALGQHWVDDLAVECVADVQGASGELLLEIVRAGVHHQCRINLADGKATLAMMDMQGKKLEFEAEDGTTAESPTAETAVKGPGKYRLMLANCDHEMLLWVNRSVVKFNGPTTYASAELVDPQWSPEDPGDLAPAGVGSRGAAVRFDALRIWRDKYYIATLGDDKNDYLNYISIPGVADSNESRLIQNILADPAAWKSSNLFARDGRRYVEFPLEQDQFLPLGDNSPASYDGRFWIDNPPDGPLMPHHYVERDLLIGKALLIYWPHTWNRPVPFTPNFSKMGRIK